MREAMIASQHAARNYNVVFPHSLPPTFCQSINHSHLYVLHAEVLKVNGELGAMG